MDEQENQKDGVYRTGISLSKELFERAKERQKELGLKGFSAYVEHLLKQELDGPTLSERDIEMIAEQVAKYEVKKKKTKKRLGGKDGITKTSLLFAAAAGLALLIHDSSTRGTGGDPASSASGDHVTERFDALEPPPRGTVRFRNTTRTEVVLQQREAEEAMSRLFGE